MSDEMFEDILFDYLKEKIGEDEARYRVYVSSRWNGGVKLYTKNCKECDSFVEIEDIRFCLKGVAWKVLAETEKPRKCQYF